MRVLQHLYLFLGHLAPQGLLQHHCVVSVERAVKEEEDEEEEEDEAMGPAAALPEVGDEEDGEEDNDALTQGAMAAAMAALRVHEEAAELDVEPDLGARME